MASCYAIRTARVKSTIPQSGVGGPFAAGFNGKQFRIRKKNFGSFRMSVWDAKFRTCKVGGSPAHAFDTAGTLSPDKHLKNVCFYAKNPLLELDN